MKKILLNVAKYGATEVLSREELKKVLGGTGTGSAPCPSPDTACRDSSGKVLAKKPCDGLTNGAACSYYRYNGYATGCPLQQHSGTCQTSGAQYEFECKCP